MDKLAVPVVQDQACLFVILSRLSRSQMTKRYDQNAHVSSLDVGPDVLCASRKAHTTAGKVHASSYEFVAPLELVVLELLGLGAHVQPLISISLQLHVQQSTSVLGCGQAFV